MKEKNLLIEYFDKLPYKAKELILTKESYNILEGVEIWRHELESPIEEILRVALEKKMIEYNKSWFVESQTEIECKNGNTYRADFTIWHDDILNWELKEEFALVIECDGHEFHQNMRA